MVYFIRHYRKGVKNSGTRDIWTGDFVPSEEEVLEAFGQEGRFVVFQRGGGIRGMKKVTQYGPYDAEPAEVKSKNRILNSLPSAAAAEWMPKVFAAEQESINVRQQISLRDLSDDELDKLWGSMLDTPVESEDDFQKFSADTQKIRAEFNRRLGERKGMLSAFEGDTERMEEMLAENDSLADALALAQQAAEGSGLGHSTFAVVAAGVTGLVVGGVAQEVRWNKKMGEAEDRISRLESQIQELMESQTQQQSRAESDPLSTRNILQRFNHSQGM